jgi:hypothetical protein
MAEQTGAVAKEQNIKAMPMIAFRAYASWRK